MRKSRSFAVSEKAPAVSTSSVTSRSTAAGSARSTRAAAAASPASEPSCARTRTNGTEKSCARRMQAAISRSFSAARAASDRSHTESRQVSRTPSRNSRCDVRPAFSGWKGPPSCVQPVCSTSCSSSPEKPSDFASDTKSGNERPFQPLVENESFIPASPHR